MLVGYFDESGTGTKSPAISVAGYVARDTEWDRFQLSWDRCLKKFGISSHFHMTDWEARQEQFKGLTEEKRLELFQALVGILRRTFRFGVAASTIIEHYDENRPMLDPPLSPYSFCVLQCLQWIGEWAEKIGHAEHIGYVFENGAGFNGEVYSLRERIISNESLRHRYRLGSLVFEDKKILNPLQAADILAFEAWKEMCNYIIPGKEKRKLRKSAICLLRGHVRVDLPRWDGSSPEDRYRLGYFDRAVLSQPKEWRTP